MLFNGIWRRIFWRENFDSWFNMWERNNLSWDKSVQWWTDCAGELIGRVNWLHWWADCTDELTAWVNWLQGWADRTRKNYTGELIALMNWVRRVSWLERWTDCQMWADCTGEIVHCTGKPTRKTQVLWDSFSTYQKYYIATQKLPFTNVTINTF